MINLSLLRLQYEILNKSLEQIANETGLPLSAIKVDATQGNWKQMWPDTTQSSTSQIDRDSLSSAEMQELYALEQEQFTDRSKKRLQLYSLAKDMFLATKYLELEYLLIDRACKALEDVDPGAAGIRQLAAVYKDLTAGTTLSALTKFSLEVDDSGMPSVIIRDLTGSKKDQVAEIILQ